MNRGSNPCRGAKFQIGHFSCRSSLHPLRQPHAQVPICQMVGYSAVSTPAFQTQFESRIQESPFFPWFLPLEQVVPHGGPTATTGRLLQCRSGWRSGASRRRAAGGPAQCATRPTCCRRKSCRSGSSSLSRYMASMRIADHGAGAVIDLSFLPGGRQDDGAGLRSSGAAEFADIAFDALVGAGEAAAVHKVLPNPHGVAALGEARLRSARETEGRRWRTGFATVGVARGRWSPRRPRWPDCGSSRWSPRLRWPVLAWKARQSRWSPLWPVLTGGMPAPSSRWAHRDAGGSQISGSGFPANAGFLLDPAQGPAELAQRNHLLLLFFAQDIAHVDGAYRPA